MTDIVLKECRDVIRAYRTAETSGTKDGALLNMRLHAFKKLEEQMKMYCREGFNANLLIGYVKRKSHLISIATFPSETEMLMSPPRIKFNGQKIVSSVPKEYFVPEEELMFWALAAKERELDRLERDRFEEIFEIVFPEESKERD